MMQIKWKEKDIAKINISGDLRNNIKWSDS